MSVGPSALGTVLVQRLDAVLGTSMAAHANLISGARPNAVAQPGETVRPGQADATGRNPRPPVDGTAARGERGTTVADAKTAEAQGQAARNLVTRNDTTASAPTTLGQTARTILALLALYPDQAPPAQGKAPLWQPATAPGPSPAQPGPGVSVAASPGAQAAHADPAAGTAQASQAIQAARLAATPAPHLPPSAAVLAGALRQALQGSGLFYESHLSDLAFGQRSAGQVRSEPQAQLPLPAPPAAAPQARAAGAGGTPPASPADASGAPGPAAAAPAGQHGQPLASIHPDAAPLVRQQLDILANQALMWQGEAWPGTPLEWEVRREAPDQAADAGTHWATRLKLDLPRLGLVEARLTLSGDQLVMQMVAPRSAGEIHTAAASLRASLSRAGLTLSHLSVGVTPTRQDAVPT